MALGSTQPLTEMSTRIFPEGKERSSRKAGNLTAICEPIFWKTWEPRRPTTPWDSTDCYRDSFTAHMTRGNVSTLFTRLHLRLVLSFTLIWFFPPFGAAAPIWALANLDETLRFTSVY
jgi:hypothetical protein